MFIVTDSVEHVSRFINNPQNIIFFGGSCEGPHKFLKIESGSNIIQIGYSRNRHKGSNQDHRVYVESPANNILFMAGTVQTWDGGSLGPNMWLDVDNNGEIPYPEQVLYAIKGTVDFSQFN
jgi:hypothetical protein